ncbi:MAG: hypothetical protein GXP36_11785 [Actinobacteria bacterium]|uniref:Uncharacterized protein n=1 Tax=hydrothermal vent metagenome TaxID=652676 RepID=A0A3B0T7N2_9ZZZZ|nr:hypothetical protein [Actinomycetota bacterium]
MKITTAMLADAAQVQGGKLFVMGGGFDTISARKFPVVHRAITVALIAEVQPDERHRELEIAVNLIDEDGQDIGVAAQGRLRVGAPPTLPPGSPSYVPIVTPFYNVRFPTPMGYAFAVRFEDEELTRITFRIVQGE